MWSRISIGVVLWALIAITSAHLSAARLAGWPANAEQMKAPGTTTTIGALQPNSLCAKSEQVIFSCATKRSGTAFATAPFKIISLCAARDLGKERGYLQYRYGLPGKIELEFPESRTETQQRFQYTHYMRYQVDLTEINFQIDGYQYQIFDDYNGEEKPPISTRGVSVTAPGKPKEISFVCRTKGKADYSMLDEVLGREQ
jgi:hypothetical protein